VTILETGETAIMSSLMTDDWCPSLNAREIIKSRRVKWSCRERRSGFGCGNLQEGDCLEDLDIDGA
jgi:hypothetical protein